METKIFKNYNEFGSRTNKSTNGVTEDFLKDINGRRLGGRFNAAKPLLYEVPTYLR